jgi:hypothetical protein
VMLWVDIHPLTELFRANILKMLKQEGRIDDGLIGKLLKWKRNFCFPYITECACPGMTRLPCLFQMCEKYFTLSIMDFSRPGKPTDKAFLESFNSRFRQECSNRRWFLSFNDDKEKIEEWCRDYNDFRPHNSLGNISPPVLQCSQDGGKLGLIFS